MVLSHNLEVRMTTNSSAKSMVSSNLKEFLSSSFLTRGLDPELVDHWSFQPISQQIWLFHRERDLCLNKLIITRTALLGSIRKRQREHSSPRSVGALSSFGGMNQPQVVEFVEPCAWKQKERVSPDEGWKTKRLKTAQVVDLSSDQVFAKIKSEVMELGKSGKSRKEILRLEESKLIELGCAPRKRQSVPLPILKGMRAKQKERQRRRKEEEREQDIVTASTKVRGSKSKRKH